MNETLDLFESFDPPEPPDAFEPADPIGAPPDLVDRWCPICHREVLVHEVYELVPVCPIVYPEIAGFYVHEVCLESERAHDVYVLRDRPRNVFIGRRQV